MLVLRILSYAAIPVGLVAWLMLPPLFSLVIILSLAYADELYLREKCKTQREQMGEAKLEQSTVEWQTMKQSEGIRR